MKDLERSTGDPPAWLREELYDFWRLSTQRLLACMVLGEAEGESLTGKIAVACVARNRVHKPGWWGDTYHTVILKSAQFSCFNRGSPRIGPMRDPERLSAWTECVGAANDVLSGCDDLTHGANHYCTRAVAPHTGWAIGRDPVAVIGHHNFYRL